MNLYLVRHAEARLGGSDAQRGLSEKGFADIEKTARFAAGAGVKVGRILHSGKTRAKETAEVMGRYLKPEHGVGETDMLAPADDPWVWAGRVLSMEEDLMLVGHMPYMECLVSLLVAGETEAKVVDFRMGSIVFLRREEGRWSIGWMATPEALG
jgi:phosphohistidine phosphatase